MGFGKRLRRGLGKIVRPAARAALASLTGGASEAAMRVAKGIGAYSAKRAAKIQPASVVAAIDRTVTNTSKFLTDRQRGPTTAMPGGAPIQLVRTATVRRPRRSRAAKRLKLPEALAAELANQSAPPRPLGVQESF